MVRPDDTLRSFSFTAHQYADGTSEGELQLNSRSFDVIVHIKIDCLRVVGNVAHLSGRITYVDNPDEGEVGELNRVEVRDNEEGANAPPDQVSTIPANPGDANPTTCNEYGATESTIRDLDHARHLQAPGSARPRAQGGGIRWRHSPRPARPKTPRAGGTIRPPGSTESCDLQA